jgi:hypothetical protein
MLSRAALRHLPALGGGARHAALGWHVVITEGDLEEMLGEVFDPVGRDFDDFAVLHDD